MTAERVACQLNCTIAGVEDHPRLLRLVMRSGAVGYPAFQFDTDQRLAAVGDVITTFNPAVASPWTIASWLCSEQPSLAGRTPLAAIDTDEADQVQQLAQQWADHRRRN